MSETAQAPERISFITHPWKATKEFFKGALASVPISLLYTGIAFGASALMEHYLGWDPLKVKESTTQQLVGRLIGTVAIGATISGVANAVKVMNEPGEEQQVQATPRSPARAPSHTPEHQLSYGFAPPPTPIKPRLPDKVRHNNL